MAGICILMSVCGIKKCSWEKLYLLVLRSPGYAIQLKGIRSTTGKLNLVSCEVSIMVSSFVLKRTPAVEIFMHNYSLLILFLIYIV